MVETAEARRFGFDFSGRQLLFGLLAGVITGSLLALAVHAAVGVLDNPDANLLAGEGLFLKWGLHLAVMALAGGFFSLLVATRSFTKAALWGVLYGFIVWVLNPLLVLHWLFQLPPRVGHYESTNLGGHLVWGLALALLYTGLLRAFAPDVTVEARRAVRRPAI